MKWISVKDRLPSPESDEYFLICEHDKSMCVAAYWGIDQSETKGYDWFNGDIFVCPTHWMPLPDAPEEEC